MFALVHAGYESASRGVLNAVYMRQLLRHCCITHNLNQSLQANIRFQRVLKRALKYRKFFALGICMYRVSTKDFFTRKKSDINQITNLNPRCDKGTY
jgi:hypothetical protein